MALAVQDIVSVFKKHPVGLGGGLLSLVLAGATYMRSGGLDTRQMELEDQTRQGTRLENNVRYSAQLDEQLSQITQSIETIDGRVINPESLATNLQYFYRLESELGLTLVDLRQGQPSEPVRGAQYLPVPYNVSVQGTYSQLFEFVRRLETGTLYIKFMTMNLIPGQRTLEVTLNEDPVLTLTLNLQILGHS